MNVYLKVWLQSTQVLLALAWISWQNQNATKQRKSFKIQIFNKIDARNHPITGPCESGYWKFEKWKVKWKSGSLISRSEKWNENLVHSFREWKVKWKCLDIEIESEKWNENVSKSRLRVKSELLFQVLKIKVLQQPATSTQTVNGFVTLSFSHIACESLPFFAFVTGCCINAAFVCSHWLSQLLLPLIR